MAVAASINTNFTATTGNLEKNTKRAENVVRGFGQRLRGGLALSLPSLGQVIGASVITALAKRAFDAFKAQFDQLGDLSDAAVNLGIGTNELQGLRFGAEQAGVSADQLDTAMAKMADTIAEAASGNDAAIKTMDRLGLSAQKLSASSTGDQLRQVADALLKIGNNSQKIQTARDVFGRSGTQLLSFFRDGAQGMDNATKKFRQLGGTLTDVDVAAADLAGDTLDQVGVAFDNLAKQLSVNAAPGVTLFAEALAITTGAAANAARGQFALSRAYLEANKGAANFIQRTIESAHGWRATLTGLRADLNELFGDKEEAARLRRVAAASRNIAAGGAAAADLLEQDFQRILAAADDAARRARELRGAVGGQFDPGAAKGKKISGEPVGVAAVKFGTAAAIEAINKARGVGPKDVQIEIKNLNRKQLEALNNIERAMGRAPIVLPANLRGN